MRFVYADPPYIGCAHRYPEHPDSGKWDDPVAHVDLMRDLDEDPAVDGWALSCSAPSLGLLLPGAPAGTRVAVWVKPFAAFKRNVRVAYTWEPLLWRRRSPRRPDEPVGRDHLSTPITLQRGTVGAKPAAFAEWLAVLFGWLDGDELVDMFPGSGAIGAWFARPRLALHRPTEEVHMGELADRLRATASDEPEELQRVLNSIANEVAKLEDEVERGDVHVSARG